MTKRIERRKLKEGMAYPRWPGGTGVEAADRQARRAPAEPRGAMPPVPGQPYGGRPVPEAQEEETARR